MIDGDGDPIVYWGPLYPIILAIGISHLRTYVFFVHFLCASGSIWLWLRMSKEYLGPLYHRLFGASLVLSTPLLLVATFVWSEVLFLFLLSTYLFFLRQFLSKGYRSRLIVATIAGCLLLLQRNAGIFVILGVAFGLCSYHVYNSLAKRIVRSLFLHLVLVVSGFAFWNIHRLILGNRLYVMKELVPHYSFLNNGRIMLGELATTLLPLQWMYPLGMTFATGILVIAVIQVYNGKETHPFLLLLLSVLITYMLTWVIIPAHPDDISRFMAVILPIFYLLGWYGIEQIANHQNRIPQWALQVLFCIILLYPLLRVLKNAMLWGGYD